MKAGLFDRAEDAYKALAGGAFDTESRLALLDLHERAREWQSAIEVARQLESSGTGSFASRIAHYWCELALEADAAHQTEAAAAAIAEAREVAPRDTRPLLVAGERGGRSVSGCSFAAIARLRIRHVPFWIPRVSEAPTSLLWTKAMRSSSTPRRRMRSETLGPRMLKPYGSSARRLPSDISRRRSGRQALCTDDRRAR